MLINNLMLINNFYKVVLMSFFVITDWKQYLLELSHIYKEFPKLFEIIDPQTAVESNNNTLS